MGRLIGRLNESVWRGDPFVAQALDIVRLDGEISRLSLRAEFPTPHSFGEVWDRWRGERAAASPLLARVLEIDYSHDLLTLVKLRLVTRPEAGNGHVIVEQWPDWPSQRIKSTYGKSYVVALRPKPFAFLVYVTRGKQLPWGGDP